MSKLSEYKNNLKSGDFVAYKSRYKNSWSSWYGFLISFFTLSRYSHVGMVINLGNRPFLISADIPEIKLEPLSKTKPFYHVPMNIEWKEEYTEWLMDHIGEKYSILEAIKGYFKLSDDKNNKWFCTEFARSFYEQTGLKLDGDLTPGGMVEEVLRAENKSLTFVDTSS